MYRSQVNGHFNTARQVWVLDCSSQSKLLLKVVYKIVMARNVFGNCCFDSGRVVCLAILEIVLWL